MNYVEKNSWYITASKIVCFINNPEEYKKVYIEWVPYEPQKKCFEVWTCFDDYFSIWKKLWQEKYEILEPRARRDSYKGKKIPITNADGKVIQWMIEEIERQPLFDIWAKYEYQKQIEAQYMNIRTNKNLKLRWTLDRFSLEKKLIRDFKTCANVSKLDYELNTNEMHKYFIQLSFYELLATINYWEWFECILDVVDKTERFCSNIYKINSEKLKNHRVFIKKALDMLIECEESGVYPEIESDQRYKTFQSDYYRFLNSSIQKDYVYL